MALLCGGRLQLLQRYAFKRNFGRCHTGVGRPVETIWFDFRSEGGLRHSALEWKGQGPLVLFVHANSLCAAVWGPVVSRLPGIHAIAYDQRGHGDTDVPLDPNGFSWWQFAQDFTRVVEAVTERYGRRPDACITHSFAGDCALMALAEQPTLVEHLILLDPVLADLQGESEGASRLARGTRALGERESCGWPSGQAAADAFEDALKKSLARGKLHSESKLAFADFGSSPDPDCLWRLKCSRESEARIYERRVSISRHLAQRIVDARVDLCFAMRRRGRPNDQPSILERDSQEAKNVLSRCSPQSEMHELHGVGHFLVLEAPELVAERLQQILQGPAVS